MRSWGGCSRVAAGPRRRSRREARASLVQLLEDWRARLAVPRLSAYGITTADIPAIVADSRGSSMKTNPILLTDGEIAAVLVGSL